MTKPAPSAAPDLFAPPSQNWRRPDHRYLWLKLLSGLIFWLIFGTALAVPAWLWFRPAFWPIVAAVGVLLLWRLIRTPRWFRRLGYAETDTDVYLTQGLMWRSLTCVPYGRMQLVNVNAGPLERAFKLASVEMVTSSTDGTITIPGLNVQAARELRDRLIERGEHQQAGI